MSAAVVELQTDQEARGLTMNKPLPKKLVDELEVLDKDDIERVVVYARSLKERHDRQSRRSELMKLAGSIPKEEIAQIKAAIEKGCERIDHEGW